MEDLVEVRKAKPGQLPFTPNTIRKFHSQKKYPAIIFKVGSLLYFDLAEWHKEIQRSKDASINEARKVRRAYA